jgi:hypothetical protein
MSDNTEFDPFASDATEEPPAAEGNAEVILDDVLEGGDLDDIFSDAEIDLEEDEGDGEVQVRDLGDVYVNPLDVGLKDKMWVPILLDGVTFAEKHTPRLSSKVCVAVKVDSDNKKRIYIPFDQVEAAILAGATEVVTEMELPFFLAEANHVAPAFKQRRWPYEIEVPALTIKTALFKEGRNGRKGYKNENGPSLRKATGATQPGEKVTLKTMPEIATRMDQKIVMARISLSTKTKMRPRLDNSGNVISVLHDPETGAQVTVFATERQEGDTSTTYLMNDKSGMVWEGNPKLLVNVEPGVYAIVDSGENSGPLMEEYAQTTDYINPPFLPVPERKAAVEMRDGSVIEGQITWDTVGAITQNKAPGICVDVMFRTGKTVTAVWLGTQWSEVVPDDDEEGGGLDQFAGAKNL